MPGGNGDPRDSAADLRIVVIDYQSGNLRSVAKALEAVGAHPLVSENPSELDTADAVILPGVGSGPPQCRRWSHGTWSLLSRSL